MKALANALGLDLQLEEESQAEGSVRAGESEQRGVGLDIGGSSSGDQQQQKVVEQQQEEELVQQQQVVEQQEEEVVEQADGLNSFARQLEEQLSSCHREKPFGNQALHPELVDEMDEMVGDNKMALDLQQTEELLEKKELLAGNPCQECTAVLPSGFLCSFRFNVELSKTL